MRGRCGRSVREKEGMGRLVMATVHSLIDDGEATKTYSVPSSSRVRLDWVVHGGAGRNLLAKF